MNATKSECSDIEEDQIFHWLKQPSIPITYYQEPKLQESTIAAIKLICDILQQTDEVFITSVDVLEKYIHMKKLQTSNNYNSLVIISCGVLMSSKLIGSYPEIKIASIQRIILRFSQEEVDKNIIKQTELNMLLTLEKLPLSTTVTDLTMFLEYYIKNLKLRVNIQPICLVILNVVYISRKRLFQRIKSVYAQTVEALCVFKHLICNKFYFPSGIVLCALKITKFKNFLDIKQIMEDIGQIASIHYDHLQLLSDRICELITIDCDEE